MVSIKPYDYDENFDNHEPYTRIFENYEDISYSDEEIEACKSLEHLPEDNTEIFESKEEMDANIRRLCYGDLYVIGRIWIETLKTILVGAQLRLVPAVHAAKPPPPPERPPKMKYTDLPLYTSPHYDYKEHERNKEICPEAYTKLLHNYLLPHVKCFRKEAQNSLRSMKCCAKATCKDMCSSINNTKQDIKKYMRDPDNLLVRQGLVTTGTLAGLLAGSTVPRKLFFAGLGGLSTGALCFPKETDEFFRNFIYQTGKTAIAFYNSYCGKDFHLRERVPCADDLPQEPLKRKEQCPKKKGGYF